MLTRHFKAIYIQIGVIPRPFDMVVDEALSRLSSRQQELLKLVAEDVTSSKALASKTGLTPGSIDTLLQAAAKSLDTQGRKSAAARYVELLENSQTTSQLSLSGLPNPADPPSAKPIGTVRSVVQAIGAFLRGPHLGGEKHSLSWDQVMIRIFWVALIGMVTLTALVLFVIGFLRTFS